MMDVVAMWIGYAVMVISAVSVVSYLAIGAAKISNRAQNEALDSFGGWKVFGEFKEWYQANK